MTINERIWVVARKTFGKEIYPLWVQIEAEAWHSIWLWNDKYGPLTGPQREFAADIVCRALVRAREGEDTSHKIARYKHFLKQAKNHEAIDAGFKSRADGPVVSNEVTIAFAGIGA